MLFSRTTDTARYTSFTIEFNEEELSACRDIPGLAELNSDSWYPDGSTCVIEISVALRQLAAIVDRLDAREKDFNNMSMKDRIEELESRIKLPEVPK